MRRLLTTWFLLLAAPVFADLTFPASFDVLETSPDQFQLSLTVPLIKGRYMKVRMVVPDALRTSSEPESRTGEGSLTRVWHTPAKAEELPGSTFGLSGLLGTQHEVQFRLTTLDGRRHEASLRATQAVFVVPAPLPTHQLAGQALLSGLRRAIQHPALWFLLLAILAAGGRAPMIVAAIGMGATTALLTHWRASPIAPPPLLMALAALPPATALVWLLIGTGERKDKSQNERTWALMLLAAAVGALSGWAGLLLLPRVGLSTQELRLATALHLEGWSCGAVGMATFLYVGRTLLPIRARRVLRHLLAVFAVAWVLYHATGLIQVHGPGWGDALLIKAKSLMRLWILPFRTDWAMGHIRIPLPALACLVIAGWLCTSRRNWNRHRTRATCLLVCLAVVLIPVGALRARNPFYTPRPLSAKEATPILNTLLAKTYLAFNLDVEEDAFDQLAETLAESLVTDVYLDSRRRLTEGTRKRAVVTVKDVTLNSLEALPASTAMAGTPYRCQWTVLARVEHWQHTHLRQNSYIGDIVLEVIDGNWRMAHLALTDEQREVIAVGVPLQGPIPSDAPDA